VVAALGEKNALELNSLKVQFNKYVVPNQAALSYLAAHQAKLLTLQDGVAKSAKQWKDWFWVCVVGMVLFIPTIFFNRGRWSPSKAAEDESKHQQDVDEELRELVGAST
jgi:hypothetical protein